jgi:hypothetical protein
LTDDQGRFTFDVVPALVPLDLWGSHPKSTDADDSDSDGARDVVNERRLFQAGEQRTKETLVVRETGPKPPVQLSLAQSIERSARAAGLSGMRSLVLLEGGESANLLRVSQQLTDSDVNKDILAYLPVVVPLAKVEAESTLLSQKGWRMPARDEMVLVVLDGKGQTLDTMRVPTTDVNIGFDLATDFVKRNVPPMRDARATIATARAEAARTGRRVWVVVGGPRCGPCFSLALWMDDHRELLEKDYVIVKVLGSIDTNSSDVERELRGDTGGIPWYAMMGHDGQLLATSDGPLGNIGFPGAVESLRHLRSMFDRTAQRLTMEDRDQLIQSLETGK